jgi:hypothetical protein
MSEKFEFDFKTRKDQLMDWRRQHKPASSSRTIEQIWRFADDDYLRDTWVPAGGEGQSLADWQSRMAIRSSLTKIQTVLGVMVSNEPHINFISFAERYRSNERLIEVLTNTEFKSSASIEELRKGVFNAAKYGTAYLQVVVVNDGGVRRVSLRVLNNFNVWMDDGTLPNRTESTNDCMYRRVLSYESFLNEFSDKEVYKDVDKVPKAYDLNQSDEDGKTQGDEKLIQGVELFYMENLSENKLVIEANGVIIYDDELPQEDGEVSIVPIIFYLRSDVSQFGIGIPELIENDEEMANRLQNAEADEDQLRIHPTGTYEGPEKSDHDLRVMPGRMVRTMPGANVNYLVRPKTTTGIQNSIAAIQQRMEDKTGIGRALQGVQTGNTAFEVGVSRQSSLNRLKVPFNNLSYTMNKIIMQYVARIQQVFSVPRVYRIAEVDDIMEYLEEVNADPELFFIENQGEVGKEIFNALDFGEINAKLEKDSNGNIVESRENRFFRITPSGLKWKGDIFVDVESMFVRDTVLERQETIQLSNLLLPLFQQPREMVEKAARELLKSYDEDPRDWLPDEWLLSPEERAEQERQRRLRQPETIEDFGNALNNALGPRAGEGNVMSGGMQAASVVPPSVIQTGQPDQQRRQSAQLARPQRALGEARRSVENLVR